MISELVSRVNSGTCLTPVSHRRPRKPQDTFLRSFGLFSSAPARQLVGLAHSTHSFLHLLRSSPREPRLRMRTDAPTGSAWEEGMEIRLGPAARARSLLSLPSLGARRVVQLPASEDSAAVATAAEGGAWSPAPREGPSAGEGAGVRPRHLGLREVEWGLTPQFSEKDPLGS